MKIQLQNKMSWSDFMHMNMKDVKLGAGPNVQ